METHKDIFRKKAVVIHKELSLAHGDSFCEILDSQKKWKKVSLWYDKTGVSYPEETWELFINQLERNISLVDIEWNAIRMIKFENGKNIVAKIKIK